MRYLSLIRLTSSGRLFWGRGNQYLLYEKVLQESSHNLPTYQQEEQMYCNILLTPPCLLVNHFGDELQSRFLGSCRDGYNST